MSHCHVLPMTLSLNYSIIAIRNHENIFIYLFRNLDIDLLRDLGTLAFT